jgi:uncharacterized membrane protein YidH (DUF202 family)
MGSDWYVERYSINNPAISTTSLGFAIAKFVKSKNEARQGILTTIGCVFIVMGLILFWYGFIKTMFVNKQLRQGKAVEDYLNPSG